MLSVHNLHAFYGDFQALFGIDFEIAAGEIVAIIGANGAGKSTFLKTLCGLMRTPPETREIRGPDRSAGAPASEIVKQGIALVPEGRRLFRSLSVEENLRIGAFAQAARAVDPGEGLRLFPLLKDKRNAPAPSLSGGQQQMVAIGRALMSNPKLLICDEISLGLAPIVVKDIYDALPEIMRRRAGDDHRGAGHRHRRAGVRPRLLLHAGRVSLVGKASELSHRQISAAYFGI